MGRSSCSCNNRLRRDGCRRRLTRSRLWWQGGRVYSSGRSLRTGGGLLVPTEVLRMESQVGGEFLLRQELCCGLMVLVPVV
jgi:hypothetical protein